MPTFLFLRALAGRSGSHGRGPDDTVLAAMILLLVLLLVAGLPALAILESFGVFK